MAAESVQNAARTIALPANGTKPDEASASRPAGFTGSRPLSPVFDTADLAAPLVDLKLASAAYKASLKALQAADDMQSELLRATGRAKP